ncbi:MAG: hypothetical protein DSY88_09780 [Candidatus Poseidoniales archaeon]|nr:MAG: hypothetical protein DSY88_09780 [Candidatus Poseidoniales archaeon]
MTQISNPLLNTKLFIPRSRPDLIPRVRLTGLLQAGAWRALTLVSAPAGFGKTTLVSDWVRESGWKAAWVSNEIKTPQLVAAQHRDWRGLPSPGCGYPPPSQHLLEDWSSKYGLPNRLSLQSNWLTIRLRGVSMSENLS